MIKTRDHGGGLDAAVATYGGVRGDWLDLSTGINPVPYPVGKISPDAWTDLPDQGAMNRLLAAARSFWNVPDGAEIIASNGASAIIASIPHVVRHWQNTADETADGDKGVVCIPGPTYNEHAAAFTAQGWDVRSKGKARVHVVVHPNNPDGQLWGATDHPCTTIIDESFCDVMPEQSHVRHALPPEHIILKSFGKFWGLAGMRLGFAVCHSDAAQRLRDQLGPWSVAGPALEIGARALKDVAWAEDTRVRLAADAKQLDALVGWKPVGGTDLFRTYEVPDAATVQDHLARGHVWSRIFPYSKTWIRLGLPAPDRWGQLAAALKGLG